MPVSLMVIAPFSSTTRGPKSPGAAVSAPVPVRLTTMSPEPAAPGVPPMRSASLGEAAPVAVMVTPATVIV